MAVVRGRRELYAPMLYIGRMSFGHNTAGVDHNMTFGGATKTRIETHRANLHGIQHLSMRPLAAWGGTDYLQPSSCLGCPLASSIPFQFDELSSKSQHFLALASASSATRAALIQWVYLVDENGVLQQTLAPHVHEESDLSYLYYLFFYFLS